MSNVMDERRGKEWIENAWYFSFVSVHQAASKVRFVFCGIACGNGIFER
jgi:hypothetical protein